MSTSQSITSSSVPAWVGWGRSPASSPASWPRPASAAGLNSSSGTLAFVLVITAGLKSSVPKRNLSWTVKMQLVDFGHRFGHKYGFNKLNVTSAKNERSEFQCIQLKSMHCNVSRFSHHKLNCVIYYTSDESQLYVWSSRRVFGLIRKQVSVALFACGKQRGRDTQTWMTSIQQQFGNTLKSMCFWQNILQFWLKLNLTLDIDLRLWKEYALRKSTELFGKFSQHGGGLPNSQNPKLKRRALREAIKKKSNVSMDPFRPPLSPPPGSTDA